MNESGNEIMFCECGGDLTQPHNPYHPSCPRRPKLALSFLIVWGQRKRRNMSRALDQNQTKARRGHLGSGHFGGSLIRTMIELPYKAINTTK